MKIAQGKVVGGVVVTRARFPEGTRLTLVEHDERAPIKLDPDEKAAILKGIVEMKAGHGLPVSRLHALLSRR